MIVITGATGRLGGAVLEQVLRTEAPSGVGVSTTDPEKAAALAARGVRVRRGDYDDPASLRAAFEGADRVLIVSAPRIGPTAGDAHRAAIAAARDAGVGRIFYTSHVGSDPLSPFPPAAGHAATEVDLRESGVPFTVLRNGFYADTPLRLVRDAAASGELRVPHDGPVSWTTHEDLAPAIAAVLVDPSVGEDVITLTAGDAIDMARLAETASAVTGRRVVHTRVDDEDYRSSLIAAGVPEMGAHMSLTIFQASRQGRLGIVDPTLEALIGRPTQRIEDLVRDALAS